MTKSYFKDIAIVLSICLCYIHISVLRVNAQIQSKDSIKNIRIQEVLLNKKRTKAKKRAKISSVIDKNVFETFSPLEITSSINQVAGVYALSGAINTNRITIRGIGSRTLYGTNKLRLYFNNIPITNGTGSSTIEAFDLENLGSIEIVKGPKATAYGANLGGAILLESKETESDHTGIINNFSVGSYHMFKDNVNFTHHKDNFSLGLSYNHTEVDGYRENSNFLRNGILLNTSFDFNKNHTIGLLVNYIDYNAQIPSSISQTAFDEDPTQAAGNWLATKGYEDNKYQFFGLFYEGKLTKNLKNTTSVFFNNSDTYEARPFNILNESTKGYGFKTQFSGNLKLNTKTATYTFGAELYKDEYNWSTYQNNYSDNDGNGSLQGEQLSTNKEFRDQINISSSFTMPITEKFNAQISLGLNHTSYDFRDLFNSGEQNNSASRSFDPIFLPSLNLEYIWNPLHSTYINISKGFSNPSLEETLTPDGIINPDIAQEKGINYEIGSSLKLLDKKLNLNIALYQMDITDLLVAERVGEDQYIGRNAGKTKHQGLELDINYLIGFTKNTTIQPFVKYTLNNHMFVDFIDEDEDFSGNPLTGVPMNKFDAGFYFLANGFYWNTTYQFVDEIPLTDANTLYSDAFSVFNTKIGYEKTINKNIKLGINIGLNNIFDKKYAQSVLINAVGFGGAEPRYFYPGNNRNYYGSFKISYQLNSANKSQPNTYLTSEGL